VSAMVSMALGNVWAGSYAPTFLFRTERCTHQKRRRRRKEIDSDISVTRYCSSGGVASPETFFRFRQKLNWQFVTPGHI
jgi:hypothetical protein